MLVIREEKEHLNLRIRRISQISHTDCTHLCRDDGSVEVQLCVGLAVAGVDFQGLRVEVEGRRPVGALEDGVALLLLLLQLLGLLVDVLGLLVVGRQSQDLRSDRKIILSRRHTI